MKKIVYIFLAVVLLTACQEKVKQAKALVNVSATEVNINENIDFEFTGTADQVSVYTGDKGHVYESKNYQNTGVVLPKKKGSHSYSVPGTYHMVFVASCYGDRAAAMNQDTCSCTIRVIDNNASIRSIYAVSYNDELHAEPCNGNWLLPVPKEVWVDVKFIKVKTSMLFKFKLFSDSTTLKIDGETYDIENKYSIAQPLTLYTRANSGAELTQKLYAVYKPEFASFSINDVNASMVKDKFSYIQNVVVTLPQGTDRTQLKPVFTLYEGQKVEVNGQEIQSGDIVNLTEPTEFILTNTQTYDGKEYQVSTTIPVSVVLE